MRISKEELAEIIREELSNLSKSDSVTDTEASKVMRKDATQLSTQKGITAAERGVIKNFVQTLTAYADVKNLKSGNIFSILQKLSTKMSDVVQKSQGEQK